MKIKLQSMDSLLRLGDCIELEYSKETNYKTKLVDYLPSNSQAEWANELFHFQEQFNKLSIAELKEKIYDVNMLLLDDFVDNNIKPTIIVVTTNMHLFKELSDVKQIRAIKNYSQVKQLERV